MLTKAELIEIGAHYFDKKEVTMMYATGDKNFFFESDKSYADSHAKSKKLELFEITRGDVSKKKPEPSKESTEPEKVSVEPSDNGQISHDDLKKLAKELKIKGFGIMKYETLLKKVEEHGTT